MQGPACPPPPRGHSNPCEQAEGTGRGREAEAGCPQPWGSARWPWGFSRPRARRAAEPQGLPAPPSAVPRQSRPGKAAGPGPASLPSSRQHRGCRRRRHGPEGERARSWAGRRGKQRGEGRGASPPGALSGSGGREGKGGREGGRESSRAAACEPAAPSTTAPAERRCQRGASEPRARRPPPGPIHSAAAGARGCPPGPAEAALPGIKARSKRGR